MSTSRYFVDRLEQAGILDDESIAKLRRQVNRPGKELTAQAVAEHLVQKGELTPKQADKLVAEIEAEYGGPQTLEEVEFAGEPEPDEVVDLATAATPAASPPSAPMLGSSASMMGEGRW